MIPKIIHYCWIGDKPLTPLAKKCIASWKKVMPDYEIKLWNENNYNFNKNEFMKYAYSKKKWGFVPDYARLDIIYNYGGIYLDTDVEVLKPFDEFLKYPAFCGFESDYFINFGLGFGAQKGNALIKELIKDYENLNLNIDLETQIYIKKKEIMEYYNKYLIPSPIIQTQTLRNKFNLKPNNTRQSLNYIEVFPSKYFCPKNEINLPVKTKSAYSVHWYAASWCSNKIKLKIKIKNIIRILFGEKIFILIIKFYRKIKRIKK